MGADGGETWISSRDGDTWFAVELLGQMLVLQ